MKCSMHRDPPNRGISIIIIIIITIIITIIIIIIIFIIRYKLLHFKSIAWACFGGGSFSTRVLRCVPCLIGLSGA